MQPTANIMHNTQGLEKAGNNKAAAAVRISLHSCCPKNLGSVLVAFSLEAKIPEACVPLVSTPKNLVVKIT